MVGVVGLILAGSGAYWISTRIGGSVDSPTVAQPVVEAPNDPGPADPGPADPGPPGGAPDPDPFKSDRASFDAVPTATEEAAPGSASAELSDEQLATLRKRVSVTVFSKKQCRLCDQARTFLKKEGQPVKELDIEASETDEILLRSVNSAGTVPTFDVDGKILVGYDPNALRDAIDKAAIARSKR